ncbi:MBL fold metallo-hydrolase [Svornostia abyssi]|uniref:MBL fold metallo-hydrolase n=1 Tax=Svornostia abyssi TaxID=2898438 RepID=A0ABY5PLR6_9ACTN|nr:MBL fold metallo-hydrolase [Parviterribacteraceae bacterium J379]
MTGPVGTLREAPARFAGGLTEIAPQTYAWLQPNGDWSESNCGLVVGGDAAVLIDTAWDLRLTRRILAAVADEVGVPIRTVVATHADGDHVNGLQLLPDAEFVCAEAARDELAGENPGALRWSQTGVHLLRRFAIGPPRRFGAYLDWMLSPFEFRGIEVRGPDRTFAGRLQLTVGDRELHLHHLGPAHTAGDTIVHVPDAATVFAGDLLFTGVTPNGWTGPVAGWQAALHAIAALEPEVIVPGHGPVSDLGAVAELDRYWSWLTEHASRLLADGVSVDDAAEAIVRSDAFAAEPWGRWDCPERTVCNIVLIDRARRGVPTHITHRERPLIMWKVARLAARLRAGATPA